MNIPDAVTTEVILSPSNIILGKRDRGQGTLIDTSNPCNRIILYNFQFKTGFGHFHRGYIFTNPPNNNKNNILSHRSNIIPPFNTWVEHHHRGVKSFRMSEYHKPGQKIGENPDNEIIIRAHILAVGGGVDSAFDNHVIVPEQIISNRNQENLRQHRESGKEKYYFALYPLAPGGDIFEALQAFDSEGMVKKVFKQVFQGVQYLHNLGICHNDLKPENIVTNADKTVAHIIDFGQAIIVKNGANEQQQLPRMIAKTGSGYGTPLYSPPELHIADQQRTFDWRKADVWALGVSLYMMLVKNYPVWTNGGERIPVHPHGKKFMFLLGKNSNDTFPNFLRNNQHILPFPLSENAIDLLHRMLIGDVSKRISIDEILSHPWLAN